MGRGPQGPRERIQSYNTLAALVVELGHDLIAGDAFVFVGKSGKRAKVLWFDGTGLCLLCKRLEQGRFTTLWQRSELTTSELMLFLEGSSMLGRMALSPRSFDPEHDGRVHFPHKK